MFGLGGWPGMGTWGGPGYGFAGPGYGIGGPTCSAVATPWGAEAGCTGTGSWWGVGAVLVGVLILIAICCVFCF